MDINTTSTIAILGGTGPQGQGLALRFALAGVSVALGSERGSAHSGLQKS